jgi:oxalate decarboxylase/phosphoglucose isomerase-like protein (cupin superfamily)
MLEGPGCRGYQGPFEPRAHALRRIFTQATFFHAGDVGYVPFAMGHYIENTDTVPLRFLEVFRSSYFADVSLNQWLALTPPELVKAHLELDQQVMDALRKQKSPVVPALATRGIQKRRARKEAIDR